jgi:hypothetical protein
VDVNHGVGYRNYFLIWSFWSQGLSSCAFGIVLPLWTRMQPYILRREKIVSCRQALWNVKLFQFLKLKSYPKFILMQSTYDCRHFSLVCYHRYSMLSATCILTIQWSDYVAGNLNSNLESPSVFVTNPVAHFECNVFETQRWPIILMLVIVFVKLSIGMILP